MTKADCCDLRETKWRSARTCFFRRHRIPTWLAFGLTRYLLDNGMAATLSWTLDQRPRRNIGKSLAPFTLEFASETCGIPIETAEANCHDDRWAKSVCILWAMV